MSEDKTDEIQTPKAKAKAAVAARAEALYERLEDSKIQPDEVPGIFDAAWDLVEAAIKAGQDGRLTFTEVGALWAKITRLRNVVAAARRD